jgi:hypothetical protein
VFRSKVVAGRGPRGTRNARPVRRLPGAERSRQAGDRVVLCDQDDGAAPGNRTAAQCLRLRVAACDEDRMVLEYRHVQAVGWEVDRAAKASSTVDQMSICPVLWRATTNSPFVVNRTASIVR